MENEKDMGTVVSDYAIENFKNGLNCAESVMDALVRSGALKDSPEIVGLCTGFGGGIGLAGYTCGALSAAVMANSAIYGRPEPWKVDAEVRGSEIAEKYYRRYNRMVQDFIARNGSALCGEICAPYGDFHCKERRIGCLKMIGATAKLAYEYLQMTQDEAFALPYGPNLGGKE